MQIFERQLPVPALQRKSSVIRQLRKAVEAQCELGTVPLRFTVFKSAASGLVCEVEMIRGAADSPWARVPSIFEMRRRGEERTSQFNAVMLVPTGIDCAVGGHAGDATTAARLLASVCDHLVLHPNVVNASDINEQPCNALYVEGSVICRLLMGTAAIRKVRSNRVLTVTEARPDAPPVVDIVVNCVSAARATLGFDCPRVAVLEKELSMKMGLSAAGRATGRIERLDALFEVLRVHREEYDAVALATRITPSGETVALHHAYFNGEGPNPWGGVEAALTHTVSSLLNVPSAHAPTMSSLALRSENFGQVDPRKAAEVISMSYLFCVLKGLHNAPRVVDGHRGQYEPSVLSAEDISCLVIPDGCIGLPTLAALEQGIPVIAVRQNTNLMRNDLRQLPFARGKLFVVENYLEAAGLMAAIKAGVAPESLERPLLPTRVEPFRARGERNGNGRRRLLAPAAPLQEVPLLAES
jgi:hypothetical protein